MAVFDGGKHRCLGPVSFTNALIQVLGISTPKNGYAWSRCWAGIRSLRLHTQDRQSVLYYRGMVRWDFHPQEVETAIRNNLKPVFLVVSDKQWGMVKINQQFCAEAA